MKRKIISLITAVAMVFCLCPLVMAGPAAEGTTYYQVVVTMGESSDTSGTATFGENITLKATVKSSATQDNFESGTAVSSGSVTFYVGSSSGTALNTEAITTFEGGVASLTLSSITTNTFSAGENNIVAVYTPEGGSEGTTSEAFTLTVNKKANGSTATAPTTATQTTDSITITSAAERYEYTATTTNTLDDASSMSWAKASEGNCTISNLSAGTLYYVWARIAETGDTAASIPSTSLQVYTKPEITTASLAAATVGDGYNQSLSATANANVTWSAQSLPDGLSINGSAITGTPTAATSGAVQITLTATVGESVSSETTLDLTVNRGTLSNINAPTANTGLTASGEAQALITASTTTLPEGCQFEYALGDSNSAGESPEWSTNIPTKTESGTYYVWWRVNGGSNYNDLVGDSAITVAIGSATPTAPTITDAPQGASGLTYSGDAQNLLSSGGTASTGSMEYVVTETTVSELPSTGWSADTPQRTNAGTYRIWYRANDGRTFNTGTDTDHVDVTIKKATLTAPTGLTATVGQTLANVDLSKIDSDKGSWAWVDDTSTSFTRTGDQIFSAGFTPNEGEGANYEAIESIDLTIAVTEASTPTEKTALGTPSGLAWNLETISWTTVENADGYVVKLYKDSGAEPAQTITIGSGTTVSYKFSNITDAGSYTFTVQATANADNESYTSGAVSDASAAQNFFTVSFDMNSVVADGSITSKTVVSGGKVPQVNDPTATGYAFKGWYKETDCTTQWSFESDTVSETTTLYAKWETSTSTGDGSSSSSSDSSSGTDSTDSSDSGNSSSSSSSGTTTRPSYGNGSYRPSTSTSEKEETEPPVIKGDDGAEGWDAIAGGVEDAKNGSTIRVDMKGNTLVPSDFLAELKGKDVTVVLDMGDGITWEMNGEDITSDKLQGLDLGVELGSDDIPVNVINNITGEKSVMQLSVNHIGNFGLTAYLNVNLGASNAGYYANLFYFNERTDELEFVTYAVIGKGGSTRFAFTHASSYAIVIDNEILGTAAPQDPTTSDPTSEPTTSEPDTSKPTTSQPTSEPTTSEPTSGNPSSSTPDNDIPATGGSFTFIWIAVIVAAAAAVAGTAIYRKKRNS